jgi:hypothetical protein
MNKKENLIRAISHNNPQWIPYCWEDSLRIVSPSFVERPDFEGYDSWGCYWKYSAVTGTYPSENHLLKDVEEIPGFSAPDPYAPGLLDRAKKEIEDMDHNETRNDTLVLCSNHIGTHERAYILLGMENYLAEIILHKDLIALLFKKIFDFKLKFAMRMIDDLDIDGIYLGDDWGTQRGLFFSPQIWRELVKPHLKQMYDRIHEKGKLIFQHSCGKIEEIVPDLVEIGLDVWNPCQPCNDLARLKKEFGNKLTFWGGVDSEILDLKGETEIEAEIRKRIDEMSAGGGYYLEPSHHVNFPKENINVFIKYAKK